MVFSFVLYVAVFSGLLARAQTALQIPFIPLAVKTPYLNAWYQNNPVAPANLWPQFFKSDKILGWVGFVRVDTQAYQWLGMGYNATKTVMSSITPTKTVVRIEAGPIQFNVTFFSPIEPNDYVRQSMPFSYMYIDGFSTNDSSPHSVQVYSDITAEWAARDITTPVKWDTVEADTMIYHHVTRQTPEPLEDNNDFAEDMNVYYATPKRSGFTWRTGSATVSRDMFVQNGGMDNSKDPNFRAINAANWPVFSYAVDLGTLSPGSQPEPIVWAIGLVRNPLLRYPGLPRDQTGFYWSVYSDISSMISAFLSDFKDARDRSLTLDNNVTSAASQTSAEYADILSIVTRQIFASMDITLAKTGDGGLDSSVVRIFMKDMGVSKRTNPVDVLYGALPSLLYFNSTFVRDLLEPLFEFQTSSPYAAPDLGSTYPTVLTNTSNTHTLAVENSGSMLIMAYAHAVKSGDGSLITRYYSTLQRWADFLITNAMNPPSDSLTADGFSGNKVTNLALKSILGVYSMAKINEAVGSTNTSFMDNATRLAQNWTQQAVTETHIKYFFDDPNSWGLMYNLFPAVWLDTGLISSDILSRQGQFYMQQNGALSGFSLDSAVQNITYPHWTLLTAATVPDSLKAARTQLIHQVHQRASGGSNPFTLPMTYSTSTGGAISGNNASPIFGAAYGLLALGLPNIDIKTSPSTASIPSTSKANKTSSIVGGVLGGVAGIILIVFGLAFYRRRRKAQEAKAFREQHYTRPHPFAPTLASTPNAVSRGGAPPRMQEKSSTHTSNSSSLAPLRYIPPITGKRRENSGLPVHHSEPSTSAISDLTNTNNTSTSGADDLRVEVAELRRELESMRHLTDLPPRYT
ncbi:hypothetical protein D9756_005173 [Leucocoprinus leucothites]|uniref:DUF1793-domain-containing protein n=1 Tax=Leucocoprinus leucothites TaxID=201217 RepID=A0A8H5G8W4_9AGAR|nr:hypothetical protein D9756_005173 [Leucoagaricus leucothites]